MLPADFDLINVAKLLSAAAAFIFGVLALGARIRTDSGELTPRGKIVLAGMILSFILTAVIQVKEIGQRQAASDQQRANFDAQMSEQRRVLLYTADSLLSTRDPRLALSIHIPSASLEDGLSRRLAAAHRIPANRPAPGCIIPLSSANQIIGSYDLLVCRDFRILGQTTGKNVLFDASSSLMPNEKLERMSHALLRELNVVVLVQDTNEPANTKGEFKVPLWAYRDDWKLSWNGETLRLTLDIELPNLVLSRNGLPSLIDLAGNEVTGMITFADCFDFDDLLGCPRSLELLGERGRVDAFSIMFPHRRDIDFLRSGAHPYYRSMLGIWFKTKIPASLEDIPVATASAASSELRKELAKHSSYRSSTKPRKANSN